MSDAERLERIEGKLDALIADVRSTLLLNHAVENLRDRVIMLERERDSRPPPGAPNGEAAE